MTGRAGRGVPFVHRFYGPRWRQALDEGSRRLPRPVRQALVPLFTTALLPFLPELRRGVTRNLDRILGPTDWPSAVLRAWRVLYHFSAVLTEAHAMQARAESHGEAPLPVVVLGEEHLEAVDGQGALLCTAHLGPWALGAELLAQRGRRITLVMAEEASRFTERFSAARREGRYEVIHADGSPGSTLALLAALRRGELVGMQLDRLPADDADEGGVLELPFFGAPARFPSGPLLLARASGAPLVPCFFAMRGEGCVIHIERPIQVERTDDRQADLVTAATAVVGLLERHVRAQPFQWFTFRDFWRGTHG